MPEQQREKGGKQQNQTIADSHHSAQSIQNEGPSSSANQNNLLYSPG